MREERSEGSSVENEAPQPAVPTKARRAFDWGIVVAIVGIVVSGAFVIGRMDAGIEANGASLTQQSSKLDALEGRVRAIEQGTHVGQPTDSPPPSVTTTPKNSQIFIDGELKPGYDMGVNTSGGKTNWVTVESNMLCMDYPSGQSWGAVFITVGRPTDLNRRGFDVTQFRALRVEIKGRDGGESVEVGVKDNTDPDDGTEVKVAFDDLQQDWQVREVELSRFSTADLRRLYVVTEFVFAEKPESICVRKIEFIH